MKIVFETSNETKLEIEPLGEKTKISIGIEFHSEGPTKYHIAVLEKEELYSFIGQLLRIQAEIKKESNG